MGVLLFELLCRKVPWSDSSNDPFKVSQAIMSLSVQWPWKVEKKGKDCCQKLLKFDEKERWGGPKHDVSKLKKHPFLKHTDWNGLLNLRVRPPYVPSVSREDDLRRFDTYPDSVEADKSELSAKAKKLWEAALDNLWDRPL